MPETVDCPFCVDGSSGLNPNTGACVDCPICSGTGMLTPYDICACGGPCNTFAEGFLYCGLAKCLDTLKRDFALKQF